MAALRALSTDSAENRPRLVTPAMSYADDRDEIEELFGGRPTKRGAYSDEFNDAPPVHEEAPLPSPVVKTPVKLRPPGSVPPHPHDTPAAAPAPKRKPSILIEDEEFVALHESSLPDLFDLNLIPEGKPSPNQPARSNPPAKGAPAPSSKPAATNPAARPAANPAPPAATPAATAAAKPAARPAPPAPSSQPAAPAKPTVSPTPVPAAPAEPIAAAPTAARTKPKAADLTYESDHSPGLKDDGTSLLATRGLVKIYDGRTVVNGVDIHVRPGEIVGLLGPNGAGKTTSFYMIVGLVPPNGGEVRFQGTDVTHMPMYQRARLGMGYLPQEESIFRKLTVEENLLAVLETLPLSRKERLARCQELLERFSITHIRKNVALTCSGGEKRRLTIARSLVTMPSLLMLDEPFSGVDPIAVNEIQGIVEDLRKSGLAILITDHNARQTLELVDRAYLIYEGRVLREGSRDFLINDPVSRELYLGDRFTM